MPLNIVLIGPPGSGKGTQAVRIARRYGVPHISTGDILRQAVRDGTPLGREVAATIASGALVSDELISSLVKARLQQPDAAGGFLLDGFPPGRSTRRRSSTRCSRISPSSKSTSRTTRSSGG